MTWPDPISLAADVVTFVGIPALALAMWGFYREYRKELAKRREVRFVSQGCLEFLNGKVAINLVPLESVAAFPRAGDFVYLPGETHEGKRLGSGEYVVDSVKFLFLEAPEIEQQCPALLSKVIAVVSKPERNP
jgi:hypothetical protein